MSDSFPSNLRYTREHEWALITGTTARIGITAFAVEQLGDVTQVDMPDVDSLVEKNQVFGAVESVKAVSDLFAPLSGTVASVNEALEDSPELVNDSPYEDGWIVEISLNKESEVAELLDAEAYTAFVASQDD
jgi:glycine cleavage system H protein